MMESIDNQNVDSDDTLCFSFSDANAYVIEESGNKYLILALSKKNKKVLEIYKKLWNEITNQPIAINGGESVKYKKNLVKIKLNTNDDDLPLGKILSFPVSSICFSK